MIQVNKDKLTQKLLSYNPFWDYERAQSEAQNIIDDTDERLQKNVQEWMNDEVLSDIWLDKYCIGAIMKIRQNNDFLSALKALNEYIKDPAKGEKLIWRFKM